MDWKGIELDDFKELRQSLDIFVDNVMHDQKGESGYIKVSVRDLPAPIRVL